MITGHSQVRARIEQWVANKNRGMEGAMVANSK